MSKPKTTSLTLRKLQPNDLALCLQLDHSLETQTIWQAQSQTEGDSPSLNFQSLILPRPVRVDYPWEAEEVRQDLQTGPGQWGLVMEAEGLILAYAEVRLDGLSRQAWVRHMVVDSPWRRHHLGSLLAQELRQWAQQQGAAHMTAVTTARSYPAIRFWQTMGFRFCGYHERYYPRQDIALFFGQVL